MKRKRISPLYLMLAFVLFSGVAMIYVKNILTVDATTKEINQLQEAINKEKVEKNKLNAEIEKLIARERIVDIAKNKLNLTFPKGPIYVIKREK